VDGIKYGLHKSMHYDVLTRIDMHWTQ